MSRFLNSMTRWDNKWASWPRNMLVVDKGIVGIYLLESNKNIVMVSASFYGALKSCECVLSAAHCFRAQIELWIDIVSFLLKCS
jgi:hypothetical protein